MPNLTVSCHCCGKQYPVSWSWFVCDSCGHRVCASCLGRHSGPYNPNGGTKCSQCISGTLRPVRKV